MKRAEELLALALRSIAIACLVALALMVFIGAAALWREKEHFRVEFLALVLEDTRLGDLLSCVVWALSLLFLVALTHYGWALTARATALTPILGLPTAWLYAAIPLSGLIMSAYTLGFLIAAIRRLSGRPLKNDRNQIS